MKTVILIEDGRLQLVLTPETEHEKSALKMIEDKSASLNIVTGEYYACAGGWTRELSESRARSLMIVVDSKERA